MDFGRRYPRGCVVVALRVIKHGNKVHLGIQRRFPCLGISASPVDISQDVGDLLFQVSMVKPPDEKVDMKGWPLGPR